MNYSKENNQHKKTTIFFVSRNLPAQALKISTVFLIIITFSMVSLSCEKPAKIDQEVRAEMLKHIIPLDNAFKMYDLYTNNRNALLKDTLQKLYGKDFYDTRTVWFDIKELKEYIAYVEDKSKDNNIKPEGIKVCFSLYPDNEEYGDKANHQSVFFAPTTLNDGRQSAYTIITKEGKENVLFLKNAKNNSSQNSAEQQKAGFFTSLLIDNEGGGLLYNFGTPEPPPYENDPDFQ